MNVYRLWKVPSPASASRVQRLSRDTVFLITIDRPLRWGLSLVLTGQPPWNQNIVLFRSLFQKLGRAWSEPPMLFFVKKTHTTLCI